MYRRQSKNELEGMNKCESLKLKNEKENTPCIFEIVQLQEIAVISKPTCPLKGSFELHRFFSLKKIVCFL